MTYNNLSCYLISLEIHQDKYCYKFENTKIEMIFTITSLPLSFLPFQFYKAFFHFDPLSFIICFPHPVFFRIILGEKLRHYIISGLHQMSNTIQIANITPSRPRSYKFYSPQPNPSAQIMRVVSVEKKIFPAPLTGNHLSPLKKLIQQPKESPKNLNLFQSFGSKSCVRLNAASNSYNTSIANQQDRKSNNSNNEKEYPLKTPAFLTSLVANSSKTNGQEVAPSQQKQEQNKYKGVPPYITKKGFFKDRNNQVFPDIPKIDLSHNSSDQSSGQKSSPYARSEAQKSEKSNNDGNQKSQRIASNLLLPAQLRQKTKSLQKSNSAAQIVKVPAFIKRKTKEQKPKNTEQFYEAYKYVPNQQEQEQQSTGFEFQINIKPAIVKRSFADFQVLKQLGTGSFGKACLAIQKKIGFICVIKIIQKNMVNQYEIKSLMREIKIQSSLDHRHITSLYGFFDDQQKVYLILELLPTGNLKSQTKGRAQSQKTVSNIVFQVLAGISHMHKYSVIHRDIKTENIFTFENYMKLGDFGCAVYCDQVRRSFVGSPCYLSPQQLRNEDYDEKVDSWEIGILTYQLLFRVSPFERDILAIIQGGQWSRQLSDLCFPKKYPVTQQAKDFMIMALKKNPAQRISIEQALNHPFLKNHREDFLQIKFPQS